MFGWFTNKHSNLRRQQAATWAGRYYSGLPQQAVAASVALILVEELGVSFDGFAPTSRFIEDLRVDDDEWPVVEAVEREFCFELSDQEAEKILLVSDLIALIWQKQRPSA